MIVKNPTSGTVTYGFTTLTLTPGQTAEIDNSFMENPDYQIEQLAGLISIVKYEKDMVNNTVVISIGEPPNTPSNNQKGAMVCAVNPSATNPFSVRSELEYNEIYLKYESATEVKAYGVKYTVNNKIVELSGELLFNTLTSYTINETGGITLEHVSPSSYAYAYVDDTPELRLANVAPADMETDEWRYVGLIYIDSNHTIPNSLCVETSKDMISVVALEEDITISSLTTLTELTKSIVLLPRQILNISGYITVEIPEGETSGTGDLYYGTTPVEHIELSTEGIKYTFHINYSYRNSSDVVERVSPLFKLDGSLVVLKDYININYIKF